MWLIIDKFCVRAESKSRELAPLHGGAIVNPGGKSQAPHPVEESGGADGRRHSIHHPAPRRLTDDPLGIGPRREAVGSRERR